MDANEAARGWSRRRLPLLLIGVGGFFGAIARYVVDTWVSRMVGVGFPFGTMLVNLSGTFVLGVLFALMLERGALPTDLRAPILVGFIGAYTTFSTWMLETWRLAEGGSLLAAGVNIAASVVFGVLALFAGLYLGRLAA